MPESPSSESLESRVFELSKSLADTQLALQREISRRSEAETKLKKSVDRYWTLLDNTLVGIFRTTRNGELLYVNDALAKILEYESHDELIAADAHMPFKRASDGDLLIAELIKKGRVDRFETDLTGKSGSTIAVLLTATLENDRISGGMLDITRRKKSETALRESEERYRKLLETNPDAVLCHRQGTILIVNPAAVELFGASSEEDLLGRDIYGLIHPDDIARLKNRRDKIVNEGSRIPLTTARFIRIDGHEIIVEFIGTLVPLKDGLAVQTVARDITEKAETEALLVRTKEQFHRLFTHACVGIALHEIVYNDNGDVDDYILTDVNPAYSHILGIERDAVVGRSAKRIYGTDKAPYLEVYSAVASGGEPIVFETYFEPMDRYFRISVYSPQKNSFATVFDDVSDMKKAELKLRESEEQFRVLFEQAGNAIFLHDLSGRFHAVNSKACESLDYAEHELLKLTVADVDPDFTSRQDDKKIWNALPVAFEGRHRRKDGSLFPVEVRLSKITFREQNLVLSFVDDISRRKQAEEEREKLIVELKNALAEVRTLSGMLPICSKCKKVRDDQGYWKQIESFIEQHTDVGFSHGLCPECMDALYSGLNWYERGKKEGKY
jgi:PAS domain S-box-containing protein